MPLRDVAARLRLSAPDMRAGPGPTRPGRLIRTRSARNVLTHLTRRATFKAVLPPLLSAAGYAEDERRHAPEARGNA